MIGTLVGKYKILRPLGSGGMGEVYLGEHVVLKQLRAVKLLLPEYAKHPKIVERFLSEGKAVAATRHANVIAIDDIGQLDNGVCYMILEYLDGGTLARYIASQGGPIAPHVAVHILGQAAHGLQAAHDRNIIHRDLKPENLFLTSRDDNPTHVIVIDFGVARITDEAGRNVTKTGVVVGTPQYMAPEQHRGERVGPAADVYSLGVILYEMLTGGWLPYLDEHCRKEDYLNLAPSEIYHRQMSYPPFDPRRRVASLTDPLVELMLATLDRNPARRPASARAFAVKLAERVPTDGYHPDGLEILRSIAKPLLDIDSMVETVRSPKPAHAKASPATPVTATRYELGKKLGAGGMAEVFSASISGVGGFKRQVAVKRVLSGLSEMPAFAVMFEQEARIMSRLDHPNIVAVIAFDRDAENRLFLVMEYVDGRDLASLADTGRLPVSVTIFIIIEILQGLGYAHDFPDPTGEIHGVVHRDVSPHNVLIGWTGAVKVSDFGIAKAFAASGAARSGNVKGKIQYMSPEQANAEPLDGRSDLFAVGVILHELLTGAPLFVGTTREAMAQLMFRDIPTPSSVHPGVPADLDAITMKLLDRDRERRYASAEQAIEDLSRCADAPRNGRRELAVILAERFPDLARARLHRSGDSDQSVPPRSRDAVQITVPAPLSTLGSAASQSLPSGFAPKQRRLLLAATGLAVILGLGGLGIGLWVRRSGQAAKDQSAGIPIARSDASVALAEPPDAAQLVVREVPDTAPTDAAVATSPPDAVMVASAPADASIVAPRDAGGTVAARIDVPARQATQAARPAVLATPPRKPVVTGDLVIAVEPYADVWLDGRSVGATPLRLKVPVGAHRVLLVNTDRKIRKIVNVTVTTEKQALIEETW